MSQDIVSDVLNQIMNAKKAHKKSLVVNRKSKLLLNVLDIAKDSGYIDYSVNGREVKITIMTLSEIRSVKPRFTVSMKKLDNYVRRYLPAKNFGFLIVSTNQGLMKHQEAMEKNIGGCLVAYIY